MIADVLSEAVRYVLGAYMVLILIASLLRMGGAQRNILVRTVFRLTDPPAHWLARRFPRLIIHAQNQGVDLSPMVLIILVGVFNQFLPRLVFWALNYLQGQHLNL